MAREVWGRHAVGVWGLAHAGETYSVWLGGGSMGETSFQCSSFHKTKQNHRRQIR